MMAPAVAGDLGLDAADQQRANFLQIALNPAGAK